MPTLIIIQGFLAAGKTTFSRKIASERQALRLNVDEWMEENHSEPLSMERWLEHYAEGELVLWEKAREQLGKGMDVVMDFGFWKRKDRDEARQRAVAWHVKMEHYYLPIDEVVLRARLKARKGPVAEHNLARLHELIEQFEEPQADEAAMTVAA